MAKREKVKKKATDNVGLRVLKFCCIALFLVLPFSFRLDTYDSVTPIRTIEAGIILSVTLALLLLLKVRIQNIFADKILWIPSMLIIGYFIWSFVSASQAYGSMFSVLNNWALE